MESSNTSIEDDMLIIFEFTSLQQVKAQIAGIISSTFV